MASRARRKKILKKTKGQFSTRKNVWAAVREYDMNYSQFINKLTQAGIEINRKVLADLALNNPEAFKAIVDQVK